MKEFIIIEVDRGNEDSNTVFTRRKYRFESVGEVIREFEAVRQIEMGAKGKEEIEWNEKETERIIREDLKSSTEKVWYYESGDCVIYVIEV